MRVAPLALLGPGRRMELLDWEGAQIAAVTHGHSLGYMPAAVLTHILNRIVYPTCSMASSRFLFHFSSRAAYPTSAPRIFPVTAPGHSPGGRSGASGRMPSVEGMQNGQCKDHKSL